MQQKNKIVIFSNEVVYHIRKYEQHLKSLNIYPLINIHELYIYTYIYHFDYLDSLNGSVVISSLRLHLLHLLRAQGLQLHPVAGSLIVIGPKTPGKPLENKHLKFWNGQSDFYFIKLVGRSFSCRKL